MKKRISQFNDWFDDRIGWRQILWEALYERIPGGSRWRYVWGSTLVFTFALQMITGIFLWTAYSPSAQTAWESVYYIQKVMYLGSVVRGLHHFAAQAMVVLLAIHLIQVIIDGAYRAPREINFWVGLILMQIVLGLSLTGYLLPWDQKGYYATQVTTKIMGATPLVGQQVQELAQGGPEYGHHTLTRFFAMHAGILPGLLIAFLAAHLYVFRRHGITPHHPEGKPDAMFWPDQILKDGIACLAVLAVVLALAIFKGAELNAPANPSEAFSAARPEWYFLFLFRFLRFETVEHFGLAFGAIYFPGILMTVLVLMPITAMIKGVRGHRFNVIFTWVVTIGIVALTAVAWYEDANDPDHQAALTEAERDAHRIQELADRPSKIPVEGAVTLLRSDPFTQGPRIFAKYCSSCHRYNGHDGRGRMVMLADPEDPHKRYAAKPTAADLGNFGNREWMRSIVLDYENHFSPLKNAEWYPEDPENSEAEDVINLATSEMAGWSQENREVLQQPANKESLDSLIEYLVSLSGREDLKIDETLAEAGQAVAHEGAVAEGEVSACIDCHDSLGEEFDPEYEGFGYPSLARYGSQTWLRDFLAHPGSEAHYGEKNQMPAFAEKMTEREMDLLVQWMTGDYYPTHIEELPSKREELAKLLAEQSK